MRRAEGSSTVNCAELREQTKGPGREEQLRGETKEVLASQGSEIPEEFSCLRLSPRSVPKAARVLKAGGPLLQAAVWGFANENKLLYCCREIKGWSTFFCFL